MRRLTTQAAAPPTIKPTMKPIKLSELVEALEFDSSEHVTRVDLRDGCVVMVEESLLRAVAEDEGIPIYVISTNEVNKDPISSAVAPAMRNSTASAQFDMPPAPMMGISSAA